ncbi:MAG TPA: hypothetical protein PKH10_00755 [bacterium]|nr:hypothetical protein [bacterium]
MRYALIALLVFANSALFAGTRSEAVLTGDSYVRAKWTCSAENVTGTSCLSGIPNVYGSGNDYTGVAYDWGGSMSVATYLSSLAAGYRAGSCSGSSCSTYGVLDCTVGVDCSGYVSMLWGCGHHTTSTIPDISTVIDQSAMKKGDVFNNAGSHVIMYIYTDKSTGLPYIMESAGTGTEKTVFRRMSSWPSSSYERRRYDDIADDINVDGTIQNPRVISSTPYYDEGNTRNVVSLEIDTYSALPGTKEFGPEVVYRIDLQSAGDLTATVTDNQAESIDCDVHLLSSLTIDGNGMAVDALVRDDHSVTRTLDAGTYYIVVDTYTGTTDLPGEYTLSVDFVPSGTPTDDEPLPDEDTSVYDVVQADEDVAVSDEEMPDTEMPDQNGGDDTDEASVTDNEVSADTDMLLPDEQNDTAGENPDDESLLEESSGCSCSIVQI